MYSKQQLEEIAKYLVEHSELNFLEDITFTGDVSIGGDASVAGDLSVTGDVKTFENIVDKYGHKRFIEGSCNLHEITGLTFSYNKWSLSGTHLMIVLAGSIVNGTEIAAGVWANIPDLPAWIKDKLIPMFGSNISKETASVFASDGTSQNLNAYLQKTGADLIQIYCSSITLTQDRAFRIEFDLLIDNEVVEP